MLTGENQEGKGLLESFGDLKVHLIAQKNTYGLGDSRPLMVKAGEKTQEIT